jgi:hypothetical protein
MAPAKPATRPGAPEICTFTTAAHCPLVAAPKPGQVSPGGWAEADRREAPMAPLAVPYAMAVNGMPASSSPPGPM